jgi:cell division septation protein DedD
MSRKGIAIAALILAALMQGSAQEADVEKYIGMVNNGRVEEVRGEIPALLARYPNDPGVLYLQALVTKDGAEAARIYQSVVDNFPKSKYADASLYRLYQFYYALGLYRTADLKLAQLRQEYPGSRYLTKSGVVDPASLKEEGEGVPQPETPSPAAPAQEKAGSEAAAVTPAPAAAIPASGFTLQAGAYSTQANAEKQKALFEKLGYDVEMITKVKDTKTLYVVRVGSYPTVEAARVKAAEIKKNQKIDCMVVTR